MGKQETFMSCFGCSSVEHRHLEFEDFGFILSTKPRQCHGSRRREGGGDLTLVVRIFHARCDVLLSFVFFSVPFIFCRFSRETSTEFLTAVGTYRLPATNGLSVQSYCLGIVN